LRSGGAAEMVLLLGNPHARRAKVVEGGLGGVLGSTAGLLRQLRWRRRGGAAGARRRRVLCTAEQGEAGGARGLRRRGRRGRGPGRPQGAFIRRRGDLGVRAQGKAGEHLGGDRGCGCERREKALTRGPGRSVAGRGARAGRAGCGCQVGRLGCGAGCQRDAAAGDARASAERAEWLTGWPALSVGDARGWRGLSGDGFAEPEGKEGRAGVGLLGWAAGEGAGPAQGKGEGRTGRGSFGPAGLRRAGPGKEWDRGRR